MKILGSIFYIAVRFFSVIYKIYCLLFFALTLLIVYPICKPLLLSSRGFPIVFRIERIFAKVVLIFLILPVRFKRPKPILPNGPFIICPNHSSFFDIPCLYFIFTKYFTFVGKKEITKWPLFRIFYTSGMNILVDRNDKSGAGSTFKRMLAEIDMGHPLMMFPEGTITKNAPFMGDFKDGGFRIAVMKQIPIVPVTFINNYKRMERRGFFSGHASPGFCDLIIHEPVQTTGKTKSDIPELMRQVKEIIAEPLYPKEQLKG